MLIFNARLNVKQTECILHFLTSTEALGRIIWSFYSPAQERIRLWLPALKSRYYNAKKKKEKKNFTAKLTVTWLRLSWKSNETKGENSFISIQVLRVGTYSYIIHFEMYTTLASYLNFLASYYSTKSWFSLSFLATKSRNIHKIAVEDSSSKALQYGERYQKLRNVFCTVTFLRRGFSYLSRLSKALRKWK